MPKAIAPDYDQQFLFPPALEDFVPPHHPARFLREFVDQLDLATLGLQAPENSAGRPPYAPSLLLKIWLYGYLHRIRSTRQLEAACSEHLALLWLTGMIVPDHNSLWRFWRDQKAALRLVFKHSVELAVRSGLAGLALQAVDGTKIEAAASGRSGWTREHMLDLLAALDAQLDRTEADVQEAGEPTQGYRLPESLSQKEALRATVKEGLRELEQSGRAHYHPGEPEARRMQCDGKNRFGYNAQAVVDQKNGVALAAEVVAQENDVGQLAPMAAQARENIGSPKSGPLTLADSGYGAGADIAQAQSQALAVLVYPQEGTPAGGNPYHASAFQYDQSADRVICPQGWALQYERQRRRGEEVERIFRCRCRTCPVQAQCTGDRRGRTIAVRAFTPAVQDMRKRLADPCAQALLKKRKEIVEKHFARIKEHMRFRRWTARGLNNARAQWWLVNCVSNLQVLIAHWRMRA